MRMNKAEMNETKLEQVNGGDSIYTKEDRELLKNYAEVALNIVRSVFGTRD